MKHVTVGSGVKGKIGFVARPHKMKQVTDNGWPVYTYVGDTGPAQHFGEGLVSYGGTWHLMRASVKSSRTTPA